MRSNAALNIDQEEHDLEQAQLLELANQLHLIAHTLASLNAEGTGEIFSGLMGYIKSKVENKNAVISCAQAKANVDPARTYDHVKQDGLASIEKVKALAPAPELDKTLTATVRLLNNPNSLFSQYSSMNLLMKGMMGEISAEQLEQDANALSMGLQR